MKRKVRVLESTIIGSSIGILNDKLKQLDITLDKTKLQSVIQIEFDKKRSVFYVHLNGITVLRICGITENIEYKSI